jgi:hypothetical protein
MNQNSHSNWINKWGLAKKGSIKQPGFKQKTAILAENGRDIGGFENSPAL